jgi:hypothetical protein
LFSNLAESSSIVEVAKSIPNLIVSLHTKDVQSAHSGAGAEFGTSYPINVKAIAGDIDIALN